MCTRGKYTSFYRKKSNVKMKKLVEKNEKTLVFTYKMQNVRGKTRKLKMEKEVMGKEESDKSRFECKVKLYKIKCKKTIA